VFGPGTDIRVPPYQRAYAWEDEEVEALIQDLLEAFRAGTIYFLGAIVVIRPRNRGPSEVVDGQQRLTTLTVMLCVLRDLSKSKDEEILLQSMIGTEVKPMPFGTAQQKWRITLNPIDDPFFRRFVQERGATKQAQSLRDAVRHQGSQSQARIDAAINHMYDHLSDMSAEERSRFVVWLLDQVSLARVRVTQFEVAYKVFQSLNHRGRALSDHDILKGVLFDRAQYTSVEATRMSEQWNTYTARLGDRGFGDLWKQIRSICDRDGAGELVSGLVSGITRQGSASEFLASKLPKYVDAYDAIMSGKTDGLRLGQEAKRRICFLRSIHHEGWRAPAVRFLAEYAYDEAMADRFFCGIECLAYTMQYSVKEREYRDKRYRRLLEAMDRPDTLFVKGSQLDLTARERSDLLDRLRGRFPNFKQRKALLMRFSAAAEGGVALDPSTDCTVEHILPRTPSKGSDWYEEWAKTRDRDDLTECVGNFTLLTHNENQLADRKPFGEKLAIYFKSGQASYALSNDLQGHTRWTPDDVRTRRDAMIQNLAQDWGL
ncbi:MAG: DUF262 domain-containing HNH endonuclease family protein, partial [Hyphomonadaceae bacterium]